MRMGYSLVACAVVLGSTYSIAIAADPPRVLFVRGADRSGGFLEAGDDASRTEQLADIDNEATNGGNHGWFELAETLRGAGFHIEQMIEPLDPSDPATGQTEGAPIAFEDLALERWNVIVLGSNNAVYPKESVDAVESYVRRGGAVLFISDANFGSGWADAPASDQAFLDRFGWTMQQDRGTYVLRRADGDFLDPTHPILESVDAMDGEGVSPIVVPKLDIQGVRSEILVRAKLGDMTRNNDRSPGQGTSRAVGPQDASLAIAYVEKGRIAGHLDRNTFFNLNGAGTSIHRFDNREYAVNLFNWLALGLNDLDRDGDVDNEDLYAIVGSPTDVNGDGVTDSMDTRVVEAGARFGEILDMTRAR